MTTGTDASTCWNSRPAAHAGRGRTVWNVRLALVMSGLAVAPSLAMQTGAPAPGLDAGSDVPARVDPYAADVKPADSWRALFEVLGEPLTAKEREELDLMPFGLGGVALEPTPEGELIPPCTIERAPAAAYAPRAGVMAPTWPGGVIPYTFSANVTTQNRTRFEQAIVILEAVCAVDWVPRTVQADYVEVRTTGAGTPEACVNSSFVGRIGGPQPLRMCSWFSQGVLLHEMMHAMGFQHEQSRADRDLFVIIRPENIPDDREFNFAIAPGTIATGPYDFTSIMHYDPCAFFVATPGVCASCSRLGSTACHTVTPTPAFASQVANMGQLNALTALDTHGMRSLYPLSTWRFVNAARAHAGPETGVGTDAWRAITPGLTGTPAGGTLYVMPGTYTGAGTYSQPMTIQAPVGGVVIR